MYVAKNRIQHVAKISTYQYFFPIQEKKKRKPVSPSLSLLSPSDAGMTSPLYHSKDAPFWNRLVVKTALPKEK